MLICDPCLSQHGPDVAEVGLGAKTLREVCEACSTRTLVYDIPATVLMAQPALPAQQEQELSLESPDLTAGPSGLRPEVKQHIKLVLDLYDRVEYVIEWISSEDPNRELLGPLVDPCNLLLRNIELIVGQDALASLLRKQ